MRTEGGSAVGMPRSYVGFAAAPPETASSNLHRSLPSRLVPSSSVPTNMNRQQQMQRAQLIQAQQAQQQALRNQQLQQQVRARWRFFTRGSALAFACARWQGLAVFRSRCAHHRCACRLTSSLLPGLAYRLSGVSYDRFVSLPLMSCDVM